MKSQIDCGRNQCCCAAADKEDFLEPSDGEEKPDDDQLEIEFI